MKISFIAETLPKKGVLVLLVQENKVLEGLLRSLDRQTGGVIKKAYQAAKWSGKRETLLDILAPNGLAVERLLLVGLGPEDREDKAKPSKQVLDHQRFERIGGMVVKKLASVAPDLVTVMFNNQSKDKDQKALAIAFGSILGNYRFDKYHTKLKKEDKGEVKELALAVSNSASAKKAFMDFAAVGQGVYLARDLAHEPANILYPAEFAKRTKALIKLGVKVEVLGEAQLKKLGMGALLGVGQGSVRESQLVVMQWKGGAAKDKPFALVGKGVCFDTGGISIKPAPGMEDMKADMGGAACVTGLMLTLAKRKAKINVVGVIALVENMPDGNAQRPGDIVRSMSGQTIEVLNTDAEGRLVLADALWYTQEKFKPIAIVNFATLTGAILVALGKEYAGLFSNHDVLAERLYQAGQEEGEKVWRLPMSSTYDKMINSKTADVKNISGGREAGSITAAQFLQRFIKKGQAWAHVDIAGTAMGTKITPISPAWASGFGVRLINGLIKKFYEKKS